MATPASTPTSFSISPLPENVYDSYDDAEAALHAWNRRKGIDVTKGHHKKNNAKEIWQRDFKCDKYGQTQNNRHLTEEERIRVQRGTSKIGCTMKIRLEAVNKNDCSGRWKIVYLKDPRYTLTQLPKIPVFILGIDVGTCSVLYRRICQHKH
ncbi:hypothetical protein F443_09232 [Phytophthora nicotianae P1569]|uniref:FAR1 domain-containing protein n=1 Tax=Phytophthora nicotianae P1569 TaxID=1317065 RepID=V9F5Q0_PHYNI|nr:hypothetical protein F443_09232 [Phytophthora nicotianae P1569]